MTFSKWASTHRHSDVARPAKDFPDHLCANIGCRLEDQTRGMDDWDGLKETERERGGVKEIRVVVKMVMMKNGDT